MSNLLKFSNKILMLSHLINILLTNFTLGYYRFVYGCSFTESFWVLCHYSKQIWSAFQKVWYFTSKFLGLDASDAAPLWTAHVPFLNGVADDWSATIWSRGGPLECDWVAGDVLHLQFFWGRRYTWKRTDEQMILLYINNICAKVVIILSWQKEL